jgi:transposase
LPRYSPDLNAIEQAFAKIKYWMRVAQKRTTDETWRYIGTFVQTILPQNTATTLKMPDTLPSKPEMP